MKLFFKFIAPIVIGASFIATASAQSSLGSVTILEGGSKFMVQNQTYMSKNGAFHVRFQADGNLVVYRNLLLHDTHATEVHWATNTTGANKGGVAVLQHQGNFVIYDPTFPAPNARAVFFTPTGGTANSALTPTLKLYDNGSLEVKSSYGTWTSPGDPRFGGGANCTNPTLYTACVMKGWQSQYTHRFPACSRSDADALIRANGWSQGACPSLPNWP